MRPDLFNINTAILTGRTLVRRFREGDGALFFELVQDNASLLEDHLPQLVKQIDSPEKGEFFIRQQIAKWLTQEAYAFGIWDNESTEFIGFIHFNELDWSVPKARLTFFIDHTHTGKGIMTEALARLIQYGFEELELNKIFVQTLQDNYAAQRLVRKVGFQREGDLRNEFRRKTGALLDIMRFGITREQYGR